MTVEPLRTTYRRQVREHALRTAREETLARGWAGVRMGRVAELVGVSRPTLYKEFGDKQGLGDALALAEAELFVSGVVRELEETPGAPPAVLRSALAHCLESVGSSPLLQEMVSAGGASLLPQLTVRSAPTLELAAGAITPWLARTFPDVAPGRLAACVDVIVRLTLSHVVLPHPGAATDPAETIVGVGLLMLAASPGDPDAAPRGAAG